MTRLFALLALAVVLKPPLVRADEPRPAPVVSAVLYPDGALVSRALDVECRNGAASATFVGLPPSIDMNSLKASASGSAMVQGVSVLEQLRARPWNEEVAQLDAQIRGLATRDAALTWQIQRADADEARATSLQQTMTVFIAREAAVEPKPDIAAWNNAFDTAHRALDAARTLHRQATFEQRDVRRKMADLQARRNALAGGAAQRSYDARVALSCSDSARVELSYVISDAVWSPRYEARANEKAGKVGLTMFAEVTQTTGEAWTGVSLTLSSALARRDSRPPTLQRLLVGTRQQPAAKKTLVRRDEEAAHLAAAGAADEGPGVGAAEQGLSVQLRIPVPADVSGDGQVARLEIETVDLPATFSLITVPSVLPAVVHRAVVRNTASHPLLAGPIDLFSHGGYLGTGHMERVAEHDDVKLAFGQDETVKVRRVVLEEQSSKTGLLGSGRRLDYGYRIELAAAGSEPSTVEVQEHVPVSELDDVKVTIDKEKTTPGAIQAAADGLLTWPVTLQPGEKKNLELHFSVDIPSSYDATGL